jgi:hypothetical protein
MQIKNSGNHFFKISNTFYFNGLYNEEEVIDIAKDF